MRSMVQCNTTTPWTVCVYLPKLHSCGLQSWVLIHWCKFELERCQISHLHIFIWIWLCLCLIATMSSITASPFLLDGARDSGLQAHVGGTKKTGQIFCKVHYKIIWYNGKEKEGNWVSVPNEQEVRSARVEGSWMGCKGVWTEGGAS